MKTMKDQLKDVMNKGFKLEEVVDSPVVKSTTESSMIDRRKAVLENPYDRKPSAKFVPSATVHGISLGEKVDIPGLKGCLILGFDIDGKESGKFIAVGHAKFTNRHGGGKTVSESTYINRALIGTEMSYFQWISKSDILTRYDKNGEVK